MSINRRGFLKVFGGAVVAGLYPSCRENTREKNSPEKYEKSGRGTNLNELHGQVTNAFNKEVGDKLKKDGNLQARKLKIVLEKDARGEYTLSFCVDFIPVKQGEKPDVVFETRSTVWSGRGAKEKVDANFKENIEPWKKRMIRDFPQMTFTTEELKGGKDNLAFRACMMVGSKK